MTTLKPSPVPSRANGKPRSSNAAGPVAPKRSPGGFSLLELSIVLIIIGLVAGVSIDMGLYTIEVVKEVANNHKLNVIEQSLMSYRLANERLPCPAQASLPTSDPYYGAEADNASGTCTGGTPHADTSVSITGNPSAANYSSVAEGAVPFKALGLPESFMYDAWGYKFAYAVWAPDTAEGAFLNYGINPSCGAITVNDASGSHRTTSAVYALLSFGPDGHGSYLKSGTRYFSGSDNGNGGASPQPPVGASEWTDCHCNATTDTGYLATYVQKVWTQDPNDSKDTFDDTVRFKMRWQMADKHDFFAAVGEPCKPGLWFTDVNAGDNGGHAIAFGDVNGDGIPDMIFGASNAIGPVGGYKNGAVYVVFGKASGNGWPANPIPWQTGAGNILDGTNGFELDGQTHYDMLGCNVTTGDVNGDGIADIIVSACLSYTNSQLGSVYVIYGRKSGWSARQTVDTTFLNGGGTALNGFRIDGDASMWNAYLGVGLATGDINGDGKADILVGAPNLTANGVTNAGAVYVIYGQSSGWAATQSVSSLMDGTHGFELDGDGGHFGFSIATGDVKGDGKTDIIAGAWAGAAGTLSLAGSVYVIYGKSSGWSATQTVNTTFLNGGGTALNGFRLDGADENSGNDVDGWSVAVGDINGDGTKDIIIGGINADNSGGTVNTGNVIVIWGGQTGWSATQTLTDAFLAGGGTAVRGFRLDGNRTTDRIGVAVAAGDVNGDGIDDLIVGGCLDASGDCTAGTSTYVVFGKKTGWATRHNLDSTVAGGTNGFRLDGDPGYGFIWTSEHNDLATGDINKDGKADIGIGADLSSPSGNAGAGSAYVVYGKRSGWPSSSTLDTLLQ